MQIYVIRHTVPNIEKDICYGQSDIPVAASFNAEWKKIKQHRPKEIEAIYSSPLLRCSVLAAKLAQQYSLPVLVDNRLKELNFGYWELKKWNAIQEQELAIWMNDFVNVKCPAGESYQELYTRVSSFFRELENQKKKSVIVVTHAGVIRACCSYFQAISLENTMKLKIGYGEWVVFSV